MWYHYLIAAIFIYAAIKFVYNQVYGTYSSFVSRVPELIGLLVSYYVLKWCYNEIYPPKMFGSSRYY